MDETACLNNELIKEIKQKMHCDYLSDLRDMNRNVQENLDIVLLLVIPEHYAVQEWQDLCYYLFPHLRINLPNNPRQLRDDLVLAVRDYKRMTSQIANEKTHKNNKAY